MNLFVTLFSLLILTKATQVKADTESRISSGDYIAPLRSGIAAGSPLGSRYEASSLSESLYHCSISLLHFEFPLRIGTVGVDVIREYLL